VSDDLSGFSMMELFRAEAEGQTAVLSAGLLALEAGGPGASGADLEAMMRAAHSLKGAARIVGVGAAVRVAHALEDCFVAAQNGAPPFTAAQADVLLRAVDLLAAVSLVSEADLAGWHEAHEPLVAAAEADLAAVLAGEPPAAPGPTPEPRREPAPEPEPARPPAATTTTPAPPAPPEPAPPAPAEPAVPVPAPAATEPAAAKGEPADRVVRVAAESLTRLVGLAGESLVQSRQLRPFITALQLLRARQAALTESLHALGERAAGDRALAEQVARAKALAGECVRSLLETLEGVEDFARRGEDLSGRLHHEVLASRMRPLADGVRGFPRMVRDVARQLGKRVEFEVRGETTGVDRDILDKLEAPLNHLIRNALDHAIEPPEERAAAGKPPAGLIRLEARHGAGMLQITLSDDGRGVDPARLRKTVVEKELVTGAMAAQLSEAELLEFLFLPGFSTKEAVTELSGRGVGLDAVQNMVRAVGGVVRVTTQPGKGTRFNLQLPITRSVVRALLVRVAGEPYAFPLNRIDRILMLPRGEVQTLEGRRHFPMDGQPVGLVGAAQVLDLAPAAGGGGESLAVVVASDRSHRFGVIVDGFLGERDLEVRPLDPRLGRVPDVSSASVLDSGLPVLILDVEDLVRSIDNLLSGRRLKAPEEADAAARRGPKRVLVVDDSLTVRELERQMLEARGYAVDIAVDGLDGWNAARGAQYDLIISDVDMPRMDGIQLVRAVKADPRLKSTPVVIVSYKERDEDRMRGLDAGADAYLTKSSFHDQTLLETVADLIGEGGGRG